MSRRLDTISGNVNDFDGYEVFARRAERVAELEQKVYILDDKLIAPVAILDPLLTVKLPKSLTASTAMDALTHAVEAVVSKLGTRIRIKARLRFQALMRSLHFSNESAIPPNYQS